MGKKRRREQSEDHIQRKIRKLEEKLEKRRKRIIYSSEDESDSPRHHTPEEVRAYSPAESYPPPVSLSPHEMSPAPPLVSISPTLHEVSAEPPLDPVRPDEVQVANLDDETLQLLGEVPELENIFGKVVHKDIAARWQEILKRGLSKDTKDKLFKEYLIPANCELLVPPLLNPEAKAALTENFIKRDASMVSRQKHLSVAIASLTHTIDKIILDKDLQTVRRDLLKPLSDACRIMCDMHHYETETRKKFVISSINSELKDALANSKTDKFLFGENMSDKLKAAKTVQKSGEALKVTARSASQRNSFASNSNVNKHRGNFKTLHQRRPDAGKPQMGPRQPLAYPRGRMAGRSSLPAPRPPPPPPPPPPRKTSRR